MTSAPRGSSCGSCSGPPAAPDPGSRKGDGAEADDRRKGVGRAPRRRWGGHSGTWGEPGSTCRNLGVHVYRVSGVGQRQLDRDVCLGPVARIDQTARDAGSEGVPEIDKSALDQIVRNPPRRRRRCRALVGGGLLGLAPQRHLVRDGSVGLGVGNAGVVVVRTGQWLTHGAEERGPLARRRLPGGGLPLLEEDEAVLDGGENVSVP